MNFLTAEILETDSSDDEYIPPTSSSGPSAKPGVLSLHKTKGGLPGPSDDDNSEDSEFEDDEDSDFSEDAQAGSSHGDMGQGATGGCSAAASSSKAGSSGAAAGASASRGGGAGEKGVVEGADGPGVGDMQKEGGGAEGEKEEGHAVGEIAESPGNGGIENDGNAGKKEKGENGEEGEDEGKDEDEDEIRPVKKAKVGNGSAGKTTEIDDIWAEMNKGSALSSKVETVSNQNGNGNENGRDLLGWLGSSPVRREAKPFKVKLLDDLERENRAMEKRKAEDIKVKAKRMASSTGTGLEEVLNAVKGAKKEGVMGKTRETWTDFKGKDEDVEQELEAYKKDKDRYTDRVAFLKRTDARQWQYEQEGKGKGRGTKKR